MSEVNEDQETRKSVSKIGALLSNNKEMNNSQIYVYYSQNNWKTSEFVEIIIDEKTTFLQLIDTVIFKLKTEFYYDDIDEKDYSIMILKKKTKSPNYDYPKCNPESLVLDYGKSNFCLVEMENKDENKINNEETDDTDKNIINQKEEKEEKIEENKNEIKNEIIKEEKKNNENKNNMNNNNKNKKKNKKVEKTCNKGCNIF